MIPADEFLHLLHPRPFTRFALRPPAEAAVVVSTFEHGRWRHHWTAYRQRAATIVRLYGRDCEIFYSVALHDRHAARALLRERRPDAYLITSPPAAVSAIVLPALWVSVVPTGGVDGGRAVSGFLRSLPLRPSCVVSTGSGFDLYWLLREPWILEAGSAQAVASRLVHELQKTIRRRAQRRGFAVARHDLGGMLRFPGMVENRVTRRRVRVESLDEIRYDRGELEALIPRASAAGSVARHRAGSAAIDREAATHRDFVYGLRKLLERLGGRATTAQILTELAADDDDRHLPLRAALYELFPDLQAGELPSAHSLGCKLDRLSGRRHGSLAIIRGPKNKTGVRWSVERQDY